MANKAHRTKTHGSHGSKAPVSSSAPYGSPLEALGNVTSIDNARRMAGERGKRILRRKVGVGLAAAGLLIGGGAIVGQIQGEKDPSVLEAPSDKGDFEKDAVTNSKVLYGKLKINKANIRHTPEIKNLDGSIDDLSENVAADNLSVEATNPILYENIADGNSYYGFTVPGEDGISGLFWVATSTGGQINENGIPYSTFEPNQSMQNAMSPDFTPSLITSADRGVAIELPDKSATVIGIGSLS